LEKIEKAINVTAAVNVEKLLPNLTMEILPERSVSAVRQHGSMSVIPQKS